ncbi:hypothetical protein ACFWVF_19745 [Streptomyces sp. NPDC058659]|uniref:hypothetical protein n=1 Tax=unclassified Streptomyces TaxID=2593676 RepID=UPI0036466084
MGLGLALPFAAGITPASAQETALHHRLPSGLWNCAINPEDAPFLDFWCTSTGDLPAGSVHTFVFEVDVAQNAPCSLTNTAAVSSSNLGQIDKASDPTTITGGTCNGGNGGGGSILPINLNGIFTMFNNISTNSPGGTNAPNQNFTKTTN